MIFPILNRCRDRSVHRSGPAPGSGTRPLLMQQWPIELRGFYAPEEPPPPIPQLEVSCPLSRRRRRSCLHCHRYRFPCPKRCSVLWSRTCGQIASAIGFIIDASGISALVSLRSESNARIPSPGVYVEEDVLPRQVDLKESALPPPASSALDLRASWTD